MKKKEEPLEHRDATGKFLAWLINEQKMNFVAWKVNKRIDVGTLQSFREARQYFGEREMRQSIV